VSIFTPTDEIPFAGHPTLGTAKVVRSLREAPGDEVTLTLGVGPVPVRVEREGDGETLWMTQRAPAFGERLAHESLAAVLGLGADALDDEWPVQVVSTGLPTGVVPLADRGALSSIDVDRVAYDRMTGDREAKNVLAFCPEPRADDSDLAARVFAPYYGVPEDPATGSSNGCLAAYLARHRYFGTNAVAARVEQGYEMGRPSLLELRAEDDGPAETDENGEAVTVEVGGRVVEVAEGILL
jgi:trans-2,3-dihydro-3-hydroxyanthranilate isomerase